MAIERQVKAYRPERLTRARKNSRGGFTLIELIIALVILVIVLGMAYQILSNTLKTERWVERQSLPEKVGQAIINHIRKYIEGAVYMNLGTDRVFQVIDGGTGDSARDEIQLFTTQEPTPLEDEIAAAGGADPNSLRTITAVSFYVKENSQGQGLLTLFRRESAPGEVDPFLGGSGINFEVYDKVKSINITCFDPAEDLGIPGAMPWLESWDSAQRLQLEAEEAEAAEAANQGLPTVSNPTGTADATGAVATDEEEESVLPPAAIPTAIRIEVTIFVGDEQGLFREPDGSVSPPRTYAAIIPILAAQRIPLDVTTAGEGTDGSEVGGDATDAGRGSKAASGGTSGGGGRPTPSVKATPSR